VYIPAVIFLRFSVSNFFPPKVIALQMRWAAGLPDFFGTKNQMEKNVPK
jgi:hypothetical protein